MKKPWPPVYISGGQYNPPYDFSYGNFDVSSGQYDAIDQRIELHWKLPPRECAAFNFAVSPRQLNDGVVNLEAGNYSGSSGGASANRDINDICYNYLPYHETLHIDVRYLDTTTGLSNWKTFQPGSSTSLNNTSLNLNLNGNPQPNLFAQTQGAYFQAGSLSNVNGNYGPGTYGTPTSAFVPQYVYFNQGMNNSAIQFGTRQYQFRIYLKNKSCEILPSPDYYGTLNPEWNYLYIPDTSNNYIVLGAFGPATSPQLINISPNSYNIISTSGSNNNPTSSNPVADQSLNIPFTQLSIYGLHVNYGYTLSGEYNSGSKQVIIPPSNYLQIQDISYVSNNLTSNNWNNSNFIVDLSVNFTNTNNNIIFPGYNYYLSEYFMALNSDLSYNVYSTYYVPIGGNPYPNLLVQHPTRNQVSLQYLYSLGNGTQTTFFQDLNLVNISGQQIHNPNGTQAYRPNSSTPITVLFFYQNSHYKLQNSALNYKLVNNPDNSDTNYGTDLCNNQLCKFTFTTDSTPITSFATLDSSYTIGFLAQDSSQDLSNSYFKMSISESKDATKLPNPLSSQLIESYRLRGWYLGVDVSNIEVLNINLNNYPDISNNNYQDWNIALNQVFDNGTTQSLTYGLTIGEVPLIDVSLNNFQTTFPLPSLTTDFFGLKRPNSNIQNYNITGNFSDMYETWRPVASNYLISGDLYYANQNGALGGNSFDSYDDIWPITNPSTHNLSENLAILLTKLKNSSYYYSRDRNFNPQFYITGNYRNNITRTPSNFDMIPLDISFNGKHLWWDFTTLSPSLPFTYTLHIPGTGEYPTNYSTYSSTYSHSTSITDSQLMWCKTGFTCGQYTTNNSENPYIDYTNYYDQIRDYSSFNTTGVSKSLSYTITNDDYYAGGNKTISGTYKWLLLSDTRSNASDFGKVVLTGNTSLTLGDDYLIYVQEIDTYFNSSNNTLPSGYPSGRSGWKAVHGTWDQGATVNLNNAHEAGCYRRNTNTGATAVYNIKFYSPNSNTQIFYRIGVKNSSNIKISDVTISYGTN